MKKRLLFLVLALALCLGLTVPAIAADTSGLGAKDAQAFFNVLSERAKNNLIAFADLKDMDGDRTAELVAVDENGKVNVWQAQNGNAVQVADATFPAGTMDSMVYCTKEGKTYIRVNHDVGRWGMLDVETSFITVGGIYESLSFHSEPDGSGYDNIEEYSRTTGGKTVSITETQYAQFDAAYNNYNLLDDMFLEGAGRAWYWEGRDEGRHHESYQTVRDLLSARANTPDVPSAKAVLSPQKLSVDGRAIDCEKYNVDGSNYFKLRDLAYLLNGSSSQFGVGYDAASSTVTITKGMAYMPAGGELAAGVDNSRSAQPSSQSILINGIKHDELTVYNIGGSNFFQLRELGNVLGFEVGYDASTNTAIVRSAQNDSGTISDLLLDGYWVSFIQDRFIYKFFPDGTVNEYNGGERHYDEVINEADLVVIDSFKYTLDGDKLILHGVVLEPVTTDSPVDWDGGLYNQISKIPDDEIFFYETGWEEPSNYPDNAMYLSKLNVIRN